MRQGSRKRTSAGFVVLAGLLLATLSLGCASAPNGSAEGIPAESRAGEGRWRHATPWWTPHSIASRLTALVPAELSITPPFDCEVMGLDADLGIVLITGGSDDGVEVGHVMTVHSSSVFVGELQIEKVGQDWASGSMLPGRTRRFPAKGDNVTTRLWLGPGSW